MCLSMLEHTASRGHPIPEHTASITHLIPEHTTSKRHIMLEHTIRIELPTPKHKAKFEVSHRRVLKSLHNSNPIFVFKFDLFAVRSIF